MISAIPNQPVTFNASVLQGCLCEGREQCLIVDPEDTLQFQVGYGPCGDAEELLQDPQFLGLTAPGYWAGPLWTIGGGQACVNASVPDGSPPIRLTETSFIPTAGETYSITFIVDSLDTGPLSVSFAGVVLSESINAPGTYTFVVTAETGDPLVFYGMTLSLCLGLASVKDVDGGISVTFLNTDDSEAYSFDMTSDPERFTFDRDHMTVTIPLSEITYLEEACYRIQVVDECDSVTLTSQCISIREEPCSIVLSACSSNDAGGFYFTDYVHRMRVRGKIAKPTYQFDVREERLSNGRIDRYWADRRKIYELRIDGLDWRHHDFISSLPIFDHFYVGDDEYVMEADAVEPAYGDVYDDQGSLLLKIRPKQELVRKVRCDDDDIGCAPPPNYLVQGTGPNEDYVLQEEVDGERDRIYIY